MQEYPLEPRPKLRLWRVSFGALVSCCGPYGCGGRETTSTNPAHKGLREAIPGHEHRDPNIDGAAWYEVEFANGRVTYYRQPFALGAAKTHPTETYKTGDGSVKPCNIWGWDGSSEAPTLTPSFLCDGYPQGVRVHLYLTRGMVDLCGDSTVVLG